MDPFTASLKFLLTQAARQLPGHLADEAALHLHKVTHAAAESEALFDRSANEDLPNAIVELPAKAAAPEFNSAKE